MAEAVITLLVVVFALIAVLSLFDATNRLTRSQMSIAEMQTAQRIAHQELIDLIAMAGIGGLPEGIPPMEAAGIASGVFPDGLALAVDNNVSLGGAATDTLVGADKVVRGTDVLTLRGAFTTEVLFVSPRQPIDLDASAGRITVSVIPQADVGVIQSLEPLREILKASDGEEAFVVYDRFNPGAYVVLEFDKNASVLTNAAELRIALRLNNSARFANEYGRLARGTTLLTGGGNEYELPDTTKIRTPKTISAIGLLEEYRFFVRLEHEVEGIAASRVSPVLARTRFYPGTNVVHPEGSVDFAQDVIDLQVALGVDLDGDGRVAEIGAATGDDEVLYNIAAADGSSEPDGLAGIATSVWADPGVSVRFARVSTVIQTSRPDLTFPGALMTQVEDHDYRGSDLSIFNAGNYAKLRKRILQTTVELRNLP